MRKIVLYFTMMMMVTTTALAQYSPSVNDMFKDDQAILIRTLKSGSADSAVIYPIARLFERESNSIYSSLMSNGKLSADEKEKAVRSLSYFVKELNQNIKLQKYQVYDIPVAVQSYKTVLKAILEHKSVATVMGPLDPASSQLVAGAFFQYSQYSLMDDIAIYKRVSSSPEYILRFLDNKPDYRFADSLVVQAAAHDPMKFIAYLNRSSTLLQDKIRSNKNIYVQQIVSLAKDRNASEMLPFIIQLAEKKITPEEILVKRRDVKQYYQLLVNTLKDASNSPYASSIFLKPLRDAVKQKSLSFYVNPINDLHNDGDAVRFASIKGLRPEDMYYIITSCGEDMYTSSYLGLYKRLMSNFREQTADSLFEMVQYDNYRNFMRLSANYNVLTNFLADMPKEKTNDLMKRLIGGIERDVDAGLEKAMDIADLFPGIHNDAEVSALVTKELQSNLNRSKSEGKYLGVRLYSILLEVQGLVNEQDKRNKMWETLGDYESLKYSSLQNEKGEVVQMVLFYGDEDGIASFRNFIGQYTDSKKWTVTKNDKWVSIKSLTDKPLLIYANLPLDYEDELDIKAQDEMITYLREQSLEPSILVHRGHSYHLDKTLKRLTPSVKLAILGSCGGYNKAISIASINPDVQVIGSKKTGAKSINDPIINVINQSILDNKDISWPEVWSQLTARFKKDETSMSLFNEYFAPSSNVSLFVLKLFTIYNRQV